MHHHLTKITTIALVLVLCVSFGFSQGNTTATISGVVSSTEGPLVGAVVKATHEPTSTVGGSVTN